MHRHIWEPYKKNVVGIWEKQEGQESRWAFEGDVRKCRCGVMRFYPARKNLRQVIIEMAVV